MAFNSFVSEPKSKKEIREIARAFRNYLGIDNRDYINIVDYLDIMTKHDYLFDYEIVADDEMEESKQAETDVINHYIRIKQSVYDRACDGNKVDRMTIAHEFGHYILICIYGISFAKNLDKRGYVETYKDPEWQAAVFASEFLAPVEKIKGMSPKQISIKFGISERAARAQLKHI